MEQQQEQEQSQQNLQENIFSQHSSKQRTPQDFEQERIKLSILPQQSPNQIVQFVLMPSQTIYFKGEILYSNTQPTQIMQKHIVNYITEKITTLSGNHSFNLCKLKNQGIDINYYGLRSHEGGGKILVLDIQVYRQRFYIRKDKVILSNMGRQNSVLHKHQRLSGFIQAVQKLYNHQSILPFFVIQAQINSTIIEKCLGKDQRFVCRQSSLLSFSDTVQVTAKPMSRWVSMKGPGWVFMETKPQKDYERTKSPNFLKMLCIGYLVLWVVFAFSESVLVINAMNHQ